MVMDEVEVRWNEEVVVVSRRHVEIQSMIIPFSFDRWRVPSAVPPRVAPSARRN